MTGLDRITIDFVPHSAQRYDTVGDWFWEGNTLVIRVTTTADWRPQFLIALHELIEAALCYYKGIRAEDVDKFDLEWKPRRRLKEPGDDPRAPYHDQHVTATFHERMLCNDLGLLWSEYSKLIDAFAKNSIANTPLD